MIRTKYFVLNTFPQFSPQFNQDKRLISLKDSDFTSLMGKCNLYITAPLSKLNFHIAYAFIYFHIYSINITTWKVTAVANKSS